MPSPFSFPDRDDAERGGGDQPPRWKLWAVRGAAVAAVVLFIVLTLTVMRADKPATYNDLVDVVETGEVTEARVDPASGVVILKRDNAPTVSGGWPADDLDNLVGRLREDGAEVTVEPVNTGGGFPFFSFVLIGILGYFAYTMYRSMNPAGAMGGRGTTPSEVPDTRFTDVIGCDEAVDELREVTRFLTNPSAFERLGARMPKGFLLVGPPGTGKTLLARACAGEAGVPFYAISASDFVELFVGMGARRVRKLFAEARKHERAIVFIDELDSVGKARGRPEGMGGNDEREATLNALLVEMDGFHGSGVVVLGATNRPDVLDDALRRPGRFDRTIWVHPPDRGGRRQLLEHYLGSKTVAGDIAYDRWAKRTPGMTGAEIEAVANDAALEAVRRGLDAIDDTCLEAAVSTSYMGRERRSAVVTDRDRLVVATHEGGHATVALMLDELPNPVGASIVPRGAAGGATWLDGSDDMLITPTVAKAQLAVLLAGRAAERLCFGEASQGAHDDITKATALASAMVREWGMGSLGPVAVGGGIMRSAITDQADAETQQLLRDADDRVAALLRTHRDVLDRVRDALLDAETLGPDDLAALVTDGTPIVPDDVPDVVPDDVTGGTDGQERA